MDVIVNIDKGYVESVLASMNPGGPIQKKLDEKILRDIKPYVPYKSGLTSDSSLYASKIGEGVIVWNSPYVKQIYEGKTKDGKDINYNRDIHPLAGKMWVDRYMADHEEELVQMIISEVSDIE